jgi:hypothetical protein
MTRPDNETETPRVPAEPDRRIGPAQEAGTGFRREGMVKWLEPRQLAATAVRAVLSDVFGSYADKRELQAAMSETRDHAVADDGGDLWIDYTADLGDGFDASYTVAWLLSRRTLALTGPGETPDGRPREDVRVETERGRVLVLGGDQVYPTASRDEYQNRMAGPYRAALPYVPEDERPRMFAIPGNHDWYDGLTAFLRLFCQGRGIGAWKTEQRRSYWALKLPHGWWVLGTDIQLHADVDLPQLDYFRGVAKQMAPGDRVILCTAEPAWVHTPGKAEAFDNLAYFERVVLGDENGNPKAHLALTLTGDLHHFAHYVNEHVPGGAPPGTPAEVRHKITAGGGGAYLFGTQTQPEELHLRETKAGRTHRWRRTALFPDQHESYALRWGAPLGVLSTWRFCLVIGCLYALYAWMLENTSLRLTSPWDDTLGADWMLRASAGGVGSRFAGALGDAAWLVARTPGLLFLTALFVGALYAFTSPDDVTRTGRRIVVGVTHGLLHVVLAVSLAYVLTRVVALTPPVSATVAAMAAAARGDAAEAARARMGKAILPPAQAGEATRDSVTVGSAGKTVIGYPYLAAAGVIVALIFVGGLFGGLLFGLFLLPGVNLNEAFSGQALATHKNFIRMRLDRDGSLHVYPVGVRKPGRWRFRPNASIGASWYEPHGDPPLPHLIEAPFVIPGPGRRPAPPAPSAPSTSNERVGDAGDAGEMRGGGGDPAGNVPD